MDEGRLKNIIRELYLGVQYQYREENMLSTCIMCDQIISRAEAMCELKGLPNEWKYLDSIGIDSDKLYEMWVYSCGYIQNMYRREKKNERFSDFQSR